MSRIRSRDTKPEMAVRRLLHGRGLRYKLHDESLPGRPDLVFTKYRTVVQVRGCFWHGHGCKVDHNPSTNVHYWGPKIAKNQERDKINDALLRDLGWEVIVVWECECRGKGKIEKTIDKVYNKIMKNCKHSE